MATPYIYQSRRRILNWVLLEKDSEAVKFFPDFYKMNANVMCEIRRYWMNQWFSNIIPEIKNVLKECTPIPEDIIDDISFYFEYPYQKKRI